MMLSSTLPMRTSLPTQSASRLGREIREPSRIVYIITDDEDLSGLLGSAMEAHGTRVKWFRSSSEYLSYDRPDVASCLFIGHRLADMSGSDFQRLLSRPLTPPVIVLSDDGDIPSCVRAIKDGAHDVLTLPLKAMHLHEITESAFQEDETSFTRRHENEDLRRRWRSLTARESEVMRYVVAGLLNKQVAGELNITENTVQVHRGRVMRKMHADSLAGLVCMALRLADCGEPALLSDVSQRAW